VCYSLRYKNAIIMMVPRATQSYTDAGLNLTTRIDVFIGRAGPSLQGPDDGNGVYYIVVDVCLRGR